MDFMCKQSAGNAGKKCARLKENPQILVGEMREQHFNIPSDQGRHNRVGIAGNCLGARAEKADYVNPQQQLFCQNPLRLNARLCTGDCNTTMVGNPLTRPHATSSLPKA